MQKYDFDKLDLSLYTETLSNGLKIYVIPMTNRKNIYANFGNHFGAKDSTFIPIGENEYIKVNDGIAHFLEHKLFASKDGSDPMSFFAANGASNNAMTDHDSTMYIFDGPNHFKENLNFLLDFVQDPYFTDENVEKEKGIIAEELKMYHDNPGNRVVEALEFNTFVNHPVRIPIGGTIESIYKITKEELYKCYNTFYHPSNMYLVVSGNVSPEEVIEIARDNQSKKNFLPFEELKVKAIEEPDYVSKEFEEIRMDIMLPKIGIAYKFNYDRLDKRKVLTYLSYLFTSKFGATSLFREKMLEEGIINDSFDSYTMSTDNHIVHMGFAETKEPEKLVELIKEEMQTITFTKDDLERRRNVSISSLIKRTDSIFSMNSLVSSHLTLYNEVHTDLYNYYMSLNIDEALAIINSLDFSNYSVVIIKPLIDNK